MVKEDLYGSSFRGAKVDLLSDRRPSPLARFLAAAILNGASLSSTDAGKNSILRSFSCNLGARFRRSVVGGTLRHGPATTQHGRAGPAQRPGRWRGSPAVARPAPRPPSPDDRRAPRPAPPGPARSVRRRPGGAR